MKPRPLPPTLPGEAYLEERLDYLDAAQWQRAEEERRFTRLRRAELALAVVLAVTSAALFFLFHL